MPADTTAHRRGLTQAPVEPLDQDGVQVGIIGTIAWTIAALVLLLRGGADPVWWLWTCAVGVAVGLVGLAYCVGRRGRRRPGAQSNRTSSGSTV